MNAIFEHMRAHTSVRQFDSEPLSDDSVLAAVGAAQMAATSSHVQAYCLLRVRAAETRRELRILCGDQPQLEEAGAFFCICGDQRRHRLIAERAGEPYVPNLETFLLCVIDASLFAQNLNLAFESMGLGCCFIGGLRNRLPEADELLALPHDVFPLYGLCVGRPRQSGEHAQPRPRLAPEAVLFEERYPDDAQLLAQIDAFDAVMADYYKRRGAAGRNWTGGIRRKFQLAQREHLRAFYESKGARLG